MTENYNAGDSDRITREYFDSLLVEMRHIDSVEPSTELKLYGKTFATPIMMAALSHLDTRTRPKEADAVCIGQCVMPPLTEEGAEGVRKLVEAMTHELKWAMAVTGSPAIDRIDPGILWPK